MKKRIIITMLIMLIGLSSSAQYVCPTAQELKEKSNYWQQQAFTLTNDNTQALKNNDTARINKNYEKIIELEREQQKYLNDLYPGCLQYLKTTATPDCNKIAPIYMGYLYLPKEKMNMAKAQIQELLPKIKQTCPEDAKVLETFMK